MPLYNDIYVRDNFDDTGVYPYTGRYSWTSPDIIPLQLEVKPPSYFVDAWNGPDLGLEVKAQQGNNIYVRAKNLSSKTTTGKVTLRWCKSSLFMNPDDWWNQVVPTASGQPYSQLPQMSAGQVAIGNDPLLFIPGPVEQGFHYCLIAVIQTDDDPITKPAISTNAQYTSWILDNPAVCYRNISIVSAQLPAFQQAATFANLDDAEECFFFMVQGHDFPAGTKVDIQSSSAGCEFKHDQQFPEDPTQDQLVVTIQTVPGKFSGAVLVTITPPAGAIVPSTATADVTYGAYSSQGDCDPQLLRFARPGAFFGLFQEEHATAHMVALGQCVLEMKG